MRIFQAKLIFLSLFVAVSFTTNIMNCEWTQLQPENLGTWVDYLRLFRHGTCKYTLRSIKQEKMQEKYQIITIFFKGLGLKRLRENIIECKFDIIKGQVFNCSNISQKKQIYDKSLQQKFHIFARKQLKRGSILLQYYMQSSNLSQEIEKSILQIQIMKIIDEENRKKSQNKNLQRSEIKYLLNLVTKLGAYLILTIFASKAPLLVNYSFIHICILITITLQVIENFKNQFNSNFVAPISFSLFITFVMANFGLIGLTLKFIYSFLINQPLRFRFDKIYQINTENSSIFQSSISGSIVLKKDYVKQLKYQMMNFIGQKNIFSRIISVFLILLYKTVLNIQYQLVSLCLDLTLFIIIPVLTSFQNVDSTTEIYNEQIFNRDDLSFSRENITLPKCKLYTIFMLSIIKFINASSSSNIFSSRSIFQISFILLMMFLTLYISSAVLKNKIGKDVKIYNRQTGFLNKNLLKFFQFFKRKPQCLRQITDVNNSCAICLQNIERIDGQRQANRKKCIETQCKHIFHAECLSSWIKNKMTCPIDRNYLNRELTLRLISQALENK